MAWDLWGPSYPQVEFGTTCFPEPEWQCDFYFGYGHDVIEENALNEKLCLEVARRFIAKADTEIDELEKDLVSLQSDLAWFKREEWPDISCCALSEKIAFHDGSIKNVRNKDENSSEVQSQMNTEPAERKDEIMKDLSEKYYVEKDEQPAKTKIIDSSSESWRLDAGDADKKKISSESNSESSRHSEAKGQGPEETETSRMTSNIEQPASSITMNSSSDCLGLAAGVSDKQFTSSKTSSESSRQCEPKGQGLAPEEKETSCMTNNKQRAQTSIMGSSPDPLRITAGYLNTKTTSGCDSGSTRPWEAKGQGFLSEEKEMIPNASPHDEGNSMQNSEVKCLTSKYSSVSSIVEKTSPEISDSKLINEVAEDPLIPTADTIGTSLRLDGRGSDVSKMVETADVTATATATARSRTLKSSLTPDIKATIQKKKKPASSPVKNGGQDVLRQTAGIKKSNECLESTLCASSPTKSKYCDGEQKLIDFIPKTAQEVIKESKMSPGNKIGYPNKSLKTAGNARNQQAVKFQGSITDEEDSDQFRIVKETQKDESAGLLSKPLLNPPSPKRKRKSQLTAQNVQETCLSTTEISSNTTLISKAEKEQNSEVANDYSRLNQFLSSKQCEKSGISHGNSKTSASQSQKKTKKTTSFPPTADTEERNICIGSKGLHGDVQKKRKATATLTRPAEVKDLSLSLRLQDSARDATNGSIDLKHLEKEDPTPIPSLTLEKMTVGQLKELAKRLELKAYSKLRKIDLVELLAKAQGGH